MNKFRATNNEFNNGFHITFSNGVTVSVQFSRINYCDGGIETAEVAIWDEKDYWYVLDENNNHMSLIRVEEGSDVIGYCTPEMVASIMGMASKL
jgi:hypothetical protein